MTGAASPGGEIPRTATILFTDLVGSTELRARLRDAAADDLLRAHEHALASAVTDHAGSVVKTLGDGVLAAFASAADAVAAAEAVQRITDRANRRTDVTRLLELRVGLSAGDVVWDADDCNGTPVVTAARLCDRAGGGEILCDELVRGLARGRSRAAFRLIGELELKGLPEPVVAYRVPWEPAGSETAPLPPLLLPVPGDMPFAGRDAERDALRALWKSAQTDGRGVVLVSGEPGMGKTRLTAEVAREAHGEGAWVLAGRCDEAITAPYTPWVEMLRQVVANAPEELLGEHVERHGGELTRLVPELARRVPNTPAPRALDPESERLALFDAVLDVVESLADEAPTLLVVDDAHWADTASLDLLRHVARRLPLDTGALLVATYRDTDVDRTHPLSAMIGDLRREPRVERLALRGIDERGLCALLTAAGGQELPPDGVELARTLARETEGNPFFVVEILRHLIESGVLVHRDGRWQGSVSIDEVGIPEGIRDVVGRRLSRLSTDANDTLRTAAVVGREFTIEVLTEVTRHSDDEVLGQVEEALGTQLVNEVAGEPGRMTFSHALVRSTLLEELSTTRRVRLHRRVGEVLERDPGASAAELAYHFAEAAATGVGARAVVHARRAAEEARREVAYDQAVRFYDMALEALDAGEADAAIRSAVLSERGFAQHERDEPEAGRRDALAAAEAARAVGDPALLARAGLAYQGILTHWATPSDPVGVELMREGLAALGPDDRVTRARVTAALASSLITVPGDEALVLAEEAEQLARDAADDEARLNALAAWAWALRGRGRAAELCAVAERGVQLGVASGRVIWELTARYLLAVGLANRGELEAAALEDERSAALPSPLTGWASADRAATRALATGRFDDADDLIERAYELGAALGDTNEAVRALQHLTAALARGRLGDARKWLERLDGTAIATHVEDALVLAHEGDLDAARAASERWEEEVRPFVPHVLLDYTIAWRAEIARRLDDAELAAALRPDAELFAGEFLGSDAFHDGAAEHPLGLVALVEDRFDDAVQLLEHAVGVVEAHGLDALAARQRVDLARALLERGGPGDADRARALLTESVRAATAMGMEPTAREARELLV